MKMLHRSGALGYVGAGWVAIMAVAIFGSSVLAGPTPNQLEHGEMIELTTPSAANVVVEPWDALDGAVLVPHSSDPLPVSTVVVTVRNASNVPVENGTVTISFSQGANICGPSILSALTDSQGRVEMPVYGGGCLGDTPLSVVMKANGVTIRAYENFKSPDFDGAGVNGVIDIADLLEFKRGFLEGASDCHDYDNDGNVGLSDLLIFGPAFTRALSCGM